MAARSGDLLKQRAEAIGGHAFVCDLLDPVQVDDLIGRVESGVGPVDVLVNNAGLETIQTFHASAPSEIRDVVRLNLEVPIVLTRLVLPAMLERRRGHLVYLSSLAANRWISRVDGLFRHQGRGEQLRRRARMELKDTPISSTVVAPGPVDTEMWDRIEESQEYAALVARLRLLRLIPKASPESVAKRTVDATVSERRHVRMPTRLLANHLLREAPTRLTELLTTGVVVGPRVERSDSRTRSAPAITAQQHAEWSFDLARGSIERRMKVERGSTHGPRHGPAR